MEFGRQLQPAVLVERPNRFLAVCTMGSGSTVEAHVPNPGRMLELMQPGRRLWLMPAERSTNRKTKWTVVLADLGDGRGLASLVTTLPNRLVAEGLEQGRIDEFDGWRLDRAEVTLGRSRLDFLLRRGGRDRLALEVKSVSLVEDGVGRFPDAVTVRGARHMRELAELAGRSGWRAAVLFVAQRSDLSRVEAAEDIDPGFAEAYRRACAAGVRAYARRCRVDLTGVALTDSIPVLTDAPRAAS